MGIGGCATRHLLKFARSQGLNVGIFGALHTYGRRLNANPHIHLSVTRGGFHSEHGVWKTIYFKHHPVEAAWRVAVIRLLKRYYSVIQPSLHAGCEHIRDYWDWCRFLEVQYQRYWKVHFAKKTQGAERSVKYIGRYLKRPPISASRLAHYNGGAVVHSYLDHREHRYKTQVLSQEEMLGRYISHIPDKHFKMVRYYGFLANRTRGEQLPKVYDALEMAMPEATKKLGYAAMMKGFLNRDPYACILCGGRLRFVDAVKGVPMGQLVKQREQKLAHRRWLSGSSEGSCA